MRAIRSKDTEPEQVVRRLLHRLGYRYSLHSSDLSGKPDIVFRGRKKVIFIHGCFWHQHTNCVRARVPASNQEFWVPKLQRTIQRDQEVGEALELAGWKVIVIWECEIKRSITDVQERLVSFLGSSRWDRRRR